MKIWLAAAVLLLVMIGAVFAHSITRPEYERSPNLDDPRVFNSYAAAICAGSPPPKTEFNTIAIDCNGA
jgi:hypothetical protein